MTLRPTPDPEVVPLLRAIKARIEGLGSQVSSSPKDGVDVFYRNKTPFLQLEIRRDHMSLDLWLPAAQLDESRASGIARAHPFLGDEAVKVRFERAEDLSRVARWIEASYAYAPDRARKSARKKPSDKPVEKSTPLIKSLPPPPPPPKHAATGSSSPATPANGSPPSSSTAAPKPGKGAPKAAAAKPAKETKAKAEKKPAGKPKAGAKAAGAKKKPAKPAARAAKSAKPKKKAAAKAGRARTSKR